MLAAWHKIDVVECSCVSVIARVIHRLAIFHSSHFSSKSIQNFKINTTIFLHDKSCSLCLERQVYPRETWSSQISIWKNIFGRLNPMLIWGWTDDFKITWESIRNRGG